MITREFLEKTGYTAIKVVFSSTNELTFKDLSIDLILHFKENVDSYPKKNNFEFLNHTIFPWKFDYWKVWISKMPWS